MQKKLVSASTKLCAAIFVSCVFTLHIHSEFSSRQYPDYFTTLLLDAESVRMTEWERQRERNEFARTSQVYQPLAVSLSSRFTREDDSKKKEEVGAGIGRKFLT